MNTAYLRTRCLPPLIVLAAFSNQPPAAAQQPPRIESAQPAQSVGTLPTTPLITAEYRIGPNDLLEIQVFGVEQLNRTVRVNASGIVTLPLVGPVTVGGMTAPEIERHIAEKLADKYLQNPSVSVFIKEFTSQRVTVEGAVKKPGIYPLAGQTTLLRAMALAGGQDSLSDVSEIMLFRRNAATGQRDVLTFDLEKIRAGEVEDPIIVNDDVVVIKRSSTRVQLKDSVWRDLVDFLNPFAR